MIIDTSKITAFFKLFHPRASAIHRAVTFVGVLTAGMFWALAMAKFFSAALGSPTDSESVIFTLLTMVSAMLALATAVADKF